MSRPAAYVPGQTADSRRPPAAAGAPAPRATHPTDGGHHRRGLPGDERNRKKHPTITKNARKLARKRVSVRITYNNAHTNGRRGGLILQNWRKNAGRQPPRHAQYQRCPPPAKHQGGEVYNSEGQKKSAVRRNSHPRSHVPLSGTPIRASHASYRQVRGRGGGFETGSKKRNGQKAEVEK